jgi:predicted permease
VRLSLGASRARVIRQLLTESVLLTTLGGVIGLLLYWWLSTYIARSVQGVDVAADVGTVMFTLLLAGGTGILFGLSPALHATRGNVGGVLRDSGAGATSRSRLQRVFVTAQIVLSQPLLLLLGVMLSIAITDYRPTERSLAERLVRVNFRVPDQGGELARQTRVVETLVPRIVERPEVRGVMPEAGGYALRYVTVRTASNADSTVLLRVMAAQPGWLEHVDMKVILGRDIAFTDTAAADPAVVIGSQFARRLFGETNPVGRTLVSHRSPDRRGIDTMRVVIVGVFDQPATVSAEDVMRMYTAHRARWRRDGLVIRTHAPAEAFVPRLRTLIQSAAPALPVIRMQTQAQIDDEERGIAMRVSALAAACAAVALLLASLGLYGVVALAVRQRTREIGIRIAVGAAPSRVARMFLASGMRLGVIALLLGLPVCVVGLHLLLSNQALIAPSLDPWRIGAAIAAVLLSVVAIASWIPARRATAVDPASTLRVE